MHPGTIKTQSFYLKPGQVFASRVPTNVTTILGSCVSITMFHPKAQLGVICHAFLPDDDGSGDLKYVDNAITWMVREFDRWKIHRESIQVKLFGGAEMMSSPLTEIPQKTVSVGQKNILKAMHFLSLMNLRIKSSDVGGMRGRKIIFSTGTGSVKLKYVQKISHNFYGRHDINKNDI